MNMKGFDVYRNEGESAGLGRESSSERLGEEDIAGKLKSIYKNDKGGLKQSAQKKSLDDVVVDVPGEVFKPAPPASTSQSSDFDVDKHIGEAAKVLSEYTMPDSDSGFLKEFASIFYAKVLTDMFDDYR